jgi:N-sulfoglucosamine sulfohydrolase
MAAFQGAIKQADAAVGRIVDALARAGMLDDTLLVFLSDHGMAMPRAKCTLYDRGLEIAMLFRWPNGFAPDRRDALVSGVDVLPTLLDAAGIEMGADAGGLDGRTLLPLLRGETTQHRDVVFGMKQQHSYPDPMRAVRDDRFKLVQNFEAAYPVEVPADVCEGAIFATEAARYTGGVRPALELYDTRVDPDEGKNLAGDPTHADTQQRLERALWAWLRDVDDPLLKDGAPSPSRRRAATFGAALLAGGDVDAARAALRGSDAPGCD